MGEKRNDEKWSLYPVLTEIFHYYLLERDVSKVLAMVADDVYSLGTGDGELAVGKDQLEQMLRKEMERIPGLIDYRIYDYSEKRTGEYTWECLCRMEMIMEVQGERSTCYTARFAGSFREKDGTFQATSLHMSEAGRYQEAEKFFPLRFVPEHSRRINESAGHELMNIICRVMPGGIIGCYIEEGLPLYVINDMMLQMTGYKYGEFMEETKGFVINVVYEDDVDKVTGLVFNRIKTENQYSIEYRVKKKDGTYIWVYDVGRRIRTDDGRNAVISVLLDISDSVKIRQHFLEESERDFLTGIYNRKGGEVLISREQQDGKPYTFLMIDLDNFKRVNDMYGHGEGDKMLAYVGKLLQSSFRATDICIRLGGDEFAVFVHPCASMERIEQKVGKIMQTYCQEAGKKYPLSKTTLSVGGVFGESVKAFSEMYRMADKILYEIKRTGKGRCIIRRID